MLVGRVAGIAGLVYYLELFSEAGSVVGRREVGQPGSCGGIVGRGSLEAGVVLRKWGERLRFHGCFPLRRAGREQWRKGLRPFGKDGRPLSTGS